MPIRGAYDTVTVWNKWRNPDTNKDEWFRHVIPDCSWEIQEVRSVSGQTASVGSTISVLISENPLYKAAKDWAAGDKTAFFTFQPGDLMAKGEQTVEITGTSPYTFNQVRESLLPDVFTIRAFSDNTQGYKRGRHYDCEGV